MNEDYSKSYSEDSFWEKIKKYAKQAGKEVIEKALILYYVGIDPKTPKWAKTVIIAALGYFIMPIDAIPDMTPIVGFADDVGALVAAAAAVGACITETHITQAKEKMKEWFEEN